MKKVALINLFLILLVAQIFSQTNQDSLVPFKKVFYKLGNNTVHSFTYNYGLNAGLATIGTYALVESGFDWQWNRMAYNHDAIAYSGIPSVIIGGLVPMIVPATLYIHGRNKRDYKLQIIGLALGQAALLGLGISSSIKVFTGRKPPGILGKEKDISNNDYSSDFKFGFLERGAFDGWPSGHTMTAFAMSVCLIKLYPDNNYIKYGALAYATFIGSGVSLNIHWFSDFFAGALIGYAIGATVGDSFSNLLNNQNKVSSPLSFLVNVNKVGILYKF